MPELVLLRHGRTAWNHSRRVQGQLDAELDEVGHEQAAQVAEVLVQLKPVRLWTSDLVRARATAQHLANRTGLEPSVDPRLREFNLGERQGLTHAEYEAAAPEEFALFRQGYWDSTPGAESSAAVRERMLGALDEAFAELGDDEVGVVVSHGAALRLAIGALVNWPTDAFVTLGPLNNCGWAVIHQDPDTLTRRLAAYNRVVSA